MTFDELDRLSDEDRKAAMDAMSIGELLAMHGMTIEVERDGASAKENKAITNAVLDIRKK